MSLRFRRRNRKAGKRADPVRGADMSLGRTDASLRWDHTGHGTARQSMPRLGSVLLALVVVALLTAGIHVLFQ